MLFNDKENQMFNNARIKMLQLPHGSIYLPVICWAIPRT